MQLYISIEGLLVHSSYVSSQIVKEVIYVELLVCRCTALVYLVPSRSLRLNSTHLVPLLKIFELLHGLVDLLIQFIPILFVQVDLPAKLIHDGVSLLLHSFEGLLQLLGLVDEVQVLFFELGEYLVKVIGVVKT